MNRRVGGIVAAGAAWVPPTLMLVLLAACGTAEPTGPSTPVPAPTGPADSVPANPADTVPATSAEPAPAPTETAAPETTMSNPADRRSGEGPADRPGDRVHGYRTLTGTVELSGPCPVLRVGGDRWALVGDKASGLAAGARVEVRGTVVSPPRGCHTTRALRVTQVRTL